MVEKLILVKKELLQRVQMEKLYDSILLFAHSPHIHPLERTKRFYLMYFLKLSNQKPFFFFRLFPEYVSCSIFLKAFSAFTLQYSTRVGRWFKGAAYWQIWEIILNNLNRENFFGEHYFHICDCTGCIP